MTAFKELPPSIGDPTPEQKALVERFHRAIQAAVAMTLAEFSSDEERLGVTLFCRTQVSGMNTSAVQLLLTEGAGHA